jgi:DNA mismatch endonuclease Vsr
MMSDPFPLHRVIGPYPQEKAGSQSELSRVLEGVRQGRSFVVIMAKAELVGIMADVIDKATRSRMMAGIRGVNTVPEVKLRQALHAAGFRYRLHAKDLPENRIWPFCALALSCLCMAAFGTATATANGLQIHLQTPNSGRRS